MDMAAVHSSCRLCIHLATTIRDKEEKSPDFKKRHCKCTRGSETVYHVYVRERGRFEMESIYLRYTTLVNNSVVSLYFLYKVQPGLLLLGLQDKQYKIECHLIVFDQTN